MGKTHRKSRSYAGLTRHAAIAAALHTDYLRIVRRGWTTRAVPVKTRAAIRAADLAVYEVQMAVYEEAMAAFLLRAEAYEAGLDRNLPAETVHARVVRFWRLHAPQEPHRPYPASKLFAVPFEGQTFKDYAQEACAKQARYYDRAHRDGGPETERFAFGRTTTKSRRVDDRRRLAHIRRDPDLWEDEALSGFTDGKKRFWDWL